MILLIAFALLFSGCIKVEFGSNKDEEKFDPYKVINFKFQTLDNKIIETSSFENKVLVVNFWAISCKPCVVEIPYFIELQEKYKDQIQVIGLNVGEEKNKVREFVKKKKINYIVGYSNDEVARILGFNNVLPTTFIIGKDKRIKSKMVGLSLFENMKKILEEKINTALKESS